MPNQKGPFALFGKTLDVFGHNRFCNFPQAKRGRSVCKQAHNGSYRASSQGQGCLLTATVFPFVAVAHGIIEALIARDAKNIAVLQLLRQWNDLSKDTISGRRMMSQTKWGNPQQQHDRIDLRNCQRTSIRLCGFARNNMSVTSDAALFNDSGWGNLPSYQNSAGFAAHLPSR